MSALVNSGGGTKPLNPEIIRVILETSIPLLQELVKRIAESQSQLQEVLQKIDQLILREINSAFDALRDATITDSAETKDRRLTFAEEQLLRCTGIELNAKIGERSAAYWVALAHFGLFTISKLRGDDTLAARHVLKTFVVDPQTARTVHFPKVYSSIFEPQCDEERKWFVNRIAEVEREEFKGKVLAAKIFTASKGIAIAGFGILAMANQNTRVTGHIAANEGLQKTEKEWNEITPERYRQQMKEKVKKEFEDKLSAKCRNIAQMLLA